jgi:DNA mismatch repair protein MutS
MSTPLMRQYAQVKAKYPGTILLFRMGDFYETFEEDAITASKVLNITLTRRGNGAAGEIPLAGFPHHALEVYLPKLLKAGHRVAICEQLEDPKFAKGIVKRDVIEVVTPGVAFSDKVLQQKQNNYLVSLALPTPLATSTDNIGMSFIDVTTAEFGVSEFPLKNLPDQIVSLSPSEILIQKRDRDTIAEILRDRFAGIYTKLEDWIFNSDYGYELLINHFKTQTLKGFGIEDMTLGIVAAGAVMHYMQETQKENVFHIKKIVPHSVGEYINLDQSTRRNLEITASLNDREEGTLIWVLDHTRTPMGARLLRRWISYPLKHIGPITTRHEAVAELVEEKKLHGSIRHELEHIGDLERLVTKICTNRANPREIVALRSMLERIAGLKDVVSSVRAAGLAVIRDELQPMPSLIETIRTALADDPPVVLADGGVIRQGYNKELDDLRHIAVHGKSWIANLQKAERERTGIFSLKVGYNNVFGYYIEVTNTHKEKVPENYIRKQTLTNAERFITPELKEYEEKILNSEEKTAELEAKLFNELRLLIAAEAEAIQKNSQNIAVLDCVVSFAEVASENGYVRPEVDETTRIEIRGGRHPVIEKLLPPGEEYTPNDTIVDNEGNQILIITGPNMSGKSSYLRQAGLIVLLAQVGSFVPARSAKIGVVDRIYTRVGASDNIASGESTFLVEMHEAANIVNTATARSLILLDEVGRGTSTFDGISIAWALTEYIHNRIGAKTIFATHYHELNELADLYQRIKNLKVEVREYGDKVIFLHKVVPGFADHSYGIQVAQMAGLPDEVTERAKKILSNLEGSELTLHDDSKSQKKKVKGRIAPSEVQLTLFEMRDDPLREEIKNIDIDKITPIAALQKLASLKKKTE